MEAHSLKLPRGYIKDSVGVGDAFCSGVLYTARKELPFARSIKLGTTFAASLVQSAGATEGICSCAEVQIEAPARKAEAAICAGSFWSISACALQSKLHAPALYPSNRICPLEVLEIVSLACFASLSRLNKDIKETTDMALRPVSVVERDASSLLIIGSASTGLSICARASDR